MNQTGYYYYFGNDNYRIIELPYSNRSYSTGSSIPQIYKDLDISMYIIMSDDAITDINALINNSKLENTRINLSIPKFKVEWNIDLNDILKNMGIITAFDLKQADFKNMLTTGNTAISQVTHKTFINVDENGTEAAAITIMATPTAANVPPPKPVEFKANKPFTYVIRDNINGEILFVGEYAFAE